MCLGLLTLVAGRVANITDLREERLEIVAQEAQ